MAKAASKKETEPKPVEKAEKKMKTAKTAEKAAPQSEKKETGKKAKAPVKEEKKQLHILKY